MLHHLMFHLNQFIKIIINIKNQKGDKKQKKIAAFWQLVL